MASIVLFDDGKHKNVLLEDFSGGGAVQANQHLVIHDHAAMILDPGGHKVYAKVLGETTSLLAGGSLEYIFLSHQDPDVVAATNGWLMTTDATAYCSDLWLRFIPHFGGMTLDLRGCPLKILPAHFLHSCGNFHVYDPHAKILYSGDLGASLGMAYREVPDFKAHLAHMAGFHRRYMASSRVLRAWVAMVRKLDIECIAPQHGAIFRGRDMCKDFLDWCDTIECGMDVMLDLFEAAV